MLTLSRLDVEQHFVGFHSAPTFLYHLVTTPSERLAELRI